MSLYNVQAESGVLAGLLRHPDSYHAINDVKLSASDFMQPENKTIAKAILAVAAEHGQPDLALVTEKLLRNSKEDAVSIVNDMAYTPVTVEQAKEYAGIVKNLSVNRQIGTFGAEIISLAQEGRTDWRDTLVEVEKRTTKLVATMPEEERSPKPESILKELYASYDERRIPIRWSRTLQGITGGMAPGMLWVIGGFSSTGKSAVACNIALDAITDHKVMIISAEMTRTQYMVRMLSIISGIPQKAIRDNVTIGLDASRKLKAAEERLAASNLLIYDTIYSMDQIRSEAKKVKERDGLDLLIVDFHQNISAGGDEISDARTVAIALQRLAKELDLTVIDFSQLSNAMAQQDITEKGLGEYYAFKGSGAIKDAADLAIMLRRDRRSQSPVLNFQVAKNRHGELAEFACDFNLETGRIAEVANDWD